MLRRPISFFSIDRYGLAGLAGHRGAEVRRGGTSAPRGLGELLGPLGQGDRCTATIRERRTAAAASQRPILDSEMRKSKPRISPENILGVSSKLSFGHLEKPTESGTSDAGRGQLVSATRCGVSCSWTCRASGTRTRTQRTQRPHRSGRGQAARPRRMDSTPEPAIE